MKIVHLLGWYFPESVGGTEVYVRELSRLLRESGHAIAIAAPRAGIASPETYEHDGVPVFRYPVPAEPTRDEVQGRSPARGAAHLIGWLKERRPDVVHAHSVATGLGIDELEAAHALGSRVILTHHLPSLGYLCRAGTLMEDGVVPCDGVVMPGRCARCFLTQADLAPALAGVVSHIPPTLSRLAMKVPGRAATMAGMVDSVIHDQRRQRRLFAVCDAQVVLNETARRMFEANDLPTDRVVVNRLGISGGPYVCKPQRPTARPVRFGYLGRFDAYKGLAELVTATRHVPRDVEFRLEIRGRIASEGDQVAAAELERLAGDDRRIAIGPGPSHADVPGVLASFDVLCCVSTGFENGPTVALEALAVGTPLLATRVGNLAEIVHDGVNGRLVPSADIGALAAALADIAARPEQIDSWRVTRSTVRTMADVAADYEHLYARLVARSTA